MFTIYTSYHIQNDIVDYTYSLDSDQVYSHDNDSQQLPRWPAAGSMLQRITAGFKRPLDR